MGGLDPLVTKALSAPLTHTINDYVQLIMLKFLFSGY